MSKFNLEIKLRVPDLAGVRSRALLAGAIASGTLEQRDIFFGAPLGFLKLRIESGGRAELIAYDRPRRPGSRISRYSTCPVNDPARMEEVLSRSHELLVEVRKTRELLMLGQTRIHLDTVEGLGTFIELETRGEERSEDDVRREHEKVMETLELGRFTPIAGPYAELVLEGRSASSDTVA
jgi:predicted adenylyl cyclase CyaB